MIIWGVNAMNHDASITIVNSETCEILFAGHAERYSRVKNDTELNIDLIHDASKYGEPDLVVWFENPWGRKFRQLCSGQYSLLKEWFPARYMRSFGITCPVKYSNHHRSHAAGGYFTSGWDEAAVLVIDAIGEMTTASIWKGEGTKLKKLWALKYPHSIGLFYSAITHLCGLKPNEEEYILMGMAAYGDSETSYNLAQYMHATFFEDDGIHQKVNFHQGVMFDETLVTVAKSEQGRFDLARAAQFIVTDQIDMLMQDAQELTDCDKLVYSGGVALNCVANTNVSYIFNDTWIMPNPGDAGNSLGAVAAYLNKPLKWRGAFLGHDIQRPLDVDAIVNELMTTGICGVANGKAEFGPRAFGNRSLLADPRRQDMKDKVNEIKRRQKFRPFAPVVLQRFAEDHFNFPPNVKSAHYMQYVVDLKKPEDFPAVAHFDGTGRLQTVDSEAPILEAILEKWYEKTGCPVLLNTSLNIKGEPLVNTWWDAERWQQKYNVTVL